MNVWGGANIKRCEAMTHLGGMRPRAHIIILIMTQKFTVAHAPPPPLNNIPDLNLKLQVPFKGRLGSDRPPFLPPGYAPVVNEGEVLRASYLIVLIESKIKHEIFNQKLISKQIK